MPMACVQEATNGMNKHVSTSIKTYSDVIPCALKQKKVRITAFPQFAQGLCGMPTPSRTWQRMV